MAIINFAVRIRIRFSVSGFLRIEGNAWNEEYATIEVKAGINQTYIAEHFRQAAEALDAQIEYEIYNYGEDSDIAKN